MPRLICKESRIRIRKAKKGDLNEVFRIEVTQYTHPWKVDYFSAEFKNPLSRFYVLEDEQTGWIIAYMVFWEIDDFIELHNITVTEEYKRRGLASRLVEFLLDLAGRKGIKRISLEVRESNTAARSLYEHFSFMEVGRRRDYYSQPMEDAIIYTFDIIRPAGKLEPSVKKIGQ